MIDLANKCVLVITHEEYENILKAAKGQGYRWYGGKEVYPYPFEEQQIPDILKFYSNKELTRNASLEPGYELVEASDVIEDEKELKDAIRLVRTFAKYPDRTALADTFIESLKLLADTVESQMEEVKQMERLTDYSDDECTYIIGVGNKTCEEFCKNAVDGCKNCYIQQVFKKLADYEDLEEQGLLVRLPCKVGDTMYDIVGKPLRIVEHKVDAFHIDKKGFHLQIINGVLEKKQEAKVYFSREEAEKKLEELKNEI